MFTVEQIDHLALTVSDVERSVAWYREVLGLERRHETEWGNNPAFVYAGTTGLALFAAADPRPAAAPDHRRTRIMRHLAFRVNRENFARARAELKDKDIGFHFEDHGIAHSIYFFDPDGYEIELTTWEV
jgi:catechol 2,3-dioxygenase-like lactoylglutathione lyase family enzyme